MGVSPTGSPQGPLPLGTLGLRWPTAQPVLGPLAITAQGPNRDCQMAILSLLQESPEGSEEGCWADNSASISSSPRGEILREPQGLLGS